jgi:hypothetical protein
MVYFKSIMSYVFNKNVGTDSLILLEEPNFVFFFKFIILICKGNNLFIVYFWNFSLYFQMNIIVNLKFFNLYFFLYFILLEKKKLNKIKKKLKRKRKKQRNLL